MERKLIWIGLLLEATIAMFAWLTSNTGDRFFQICASLSARVSMVFFLWAFYHYVRKRDNGLELSLLKVFGLVHFIHLGFVIGRQFTQGGINVTWTVYPGFIVYVAILMVTLGLIRKWKIPSWSFALYYLALWIMFFMAYVLRSFLDSSMLYGSKFTYNMLLGVMSLSGVYFIYRMINERMK